MENNRQELRRAIESVASASTHAEQAKQSVLRGRAHLEAIKTSLGLHSDLEDRIARHYAERIEQDASLELPEDLRAEKAQVAETAQALDAAKRALQHLEEKSVAADGQLKMAQDSRDTAVGNVILEELNGLAEELSAVNARRWILRQTLEHVLAVPIRNKHTANPAVMKRIGDALNDLGPFVGPTHPLAMQAVVRR